MAQCTAVLLLGAATVVAADDGVALFERSVRPVIEKQCAACHSLKLTQPMGGLRLDSREAALRGGKSGAALAPGNASASLLITAIERGTMPPTGAMAARVVADFKRWVDLGAPWPAASKNTSERWWSFRPVARPPLPAANAWARTPIDRFILAKLHEKGLSPSPEADRTTLLRRVSFDLTGLPPTAEELAAFERDRSPRAYEGLVERLLASPRYGERWARHWMDVAHFAETDGYESDMVRHNSWPYRDYLVGAFNSDKPWARFIEEQIAGDVLYPANPQALVATGFLAAGPFDSNTIPPFSPDRPDVLRAYALDRDDMVQTVMGAFTSVTVHCARCHDHKFDPIPQRDHYALQSVFAGVDRAERPFDSEPAVHERRQRLIREQLSLRRRDPSWWPDANLRAEAAAWLERERARVPKWTVLDPEEIRSKNGVTFTRLDDRSILAGGANPESDTMTLAFAAPEGQIAALRIEFPTHESLPLGGPGRSSMGSFRIGEVRVTLRTAGGRVKTPCLARSRTDFEHKGSLGAALSDGKRDTAWTNYPRHGEYRQAVIPIESTLVAGAGDKLVVEIDQGGVQMIGRLRVSAASAIPADLDFELIPEGVEAERFYRLRQIDRELEALPPPQLIYAATNHFTPQGWFAPVLFPRPVYVLERGEVDKARDRAEPGALSGVTELPSRFSLDNPNEEGQRRAALAKWISDPHNPLTWRSVANRVWHFHFGRGIVDTPNDFGRMGGAPSHPELLEWLAAETLSSGGSLKHLHRLIVTSAVYRQASRPDGRTKVDSENRLLWRMNRSRLDAESIRDAVLAVSGRLDFTMGGPSVKQAVVEKGVASAPAPDYAKFNWDGPGAGRRSVYRYTFRTLSDPFMDALNCPNASIMTDKRVQSVDPLQALVLLNNPFITRHAEHMAARVERIAGSPDAASRVRTAYGLALLREPTGGEQAEAVHYVEQHGLANFCRLLLNTNEFMFVN